MKTRHILLIFILGCFAWLYTHDIEFQKLTNRLLKAQLNSCIRHLENVGKNHSFSEYSSSVPPPIDLDEGALEIPLDQDENTLENNTSLPIYKPKLGIDSLVFNLPDSCQQNIDVLAKTLSSLCANEYEGALLVYAWVAMHIRYDDESYNSGNYKSMEAEAVFNRKSGVCEGYANLVCEIGTKMGLKVEKVIGFSKESSYKPNSSSIESNHAWNIIYTENSKILLDATWGAGYGKTENGKLVTVQEYKNYWFDVNPYAMLLSHYPEDEKFQCIEPILSKTEFSKLNYLPSSFFDLNFDTKDFYKQFITGNITEVPDKYSLDIEITKSNIPYGKYLNPNKSYIFEIYTEEENKIYLFDDEESIPLKYENGKYYIHYQPKGKSIKLGYPSKNRLFYNSIFIAYQVNHNLS